jgi:hypothetical protein
VPRISELQVQGTGCPPRAKGPKSSFLRPPGVLMVGWSHLYQEASEALTVYMAHLDPGSWLRSFGAQGQQLLRALCFTPKALTRVTWGLYPSDSGIWSKT